MMSSLLDGFSDDVCLIFHCRVMSLTGHQCPGKGALSAYCVRTVSIATSETSASPMKSDFEPTVNVNGSRQPTFQWFKRRCKGGTLGCQSKVESYQINEISTVNNTQRARWGSVEILSHLETRSLARTRACQGQVCSVCKIFCAPKSWSTLSPL